MVFDFPQNLVECVFRISVWSFHFWSRFLCSYFNSREKRLSKPLLTSSFWRVWREDNQDSVGILYAKMCLSVLSSHFRSPCVFNSYTFRENGVRKIIWRRHISVLASCPTRVPEPSVFHILRLLPIFGEKLHFSCVFFWKECKIPLGPAVHCIIFWWVDGWVDGWMGGWWYFTPFDFPYFQVC